MKTTDMPNHQNGDRLSWGDTVFLHLERDGMPLHIAGTSVLEGVISLEEFRAFIESKLPVLTRYRQRVEAAPFNLCPPTWEYDPEFDLRNHVSEITLKRGTDTEFKAVVGKLLSKTMDRTRPLWDFTLVSGLKGNHTGLIFRVHHCLADGIAAVGAMNVIMTATPEVQPLPKPTRRAAAPPPKDPLTSLFDSLIGAYSNLVQRALAAQSDLLDFTERMAAGGGELRTAEFARLLPELTAPTADLCFNVNCQGPLKVAWVELPLEDLKDIRKACGTTVNDVLLALVTSTIQRYVELRGDSIKGRLFRMMVPVNTRGADSPDELGNRISLVPVTVPLDIRNPRKLLAAVHERTEFLKRGHVAELVSLAGGLVSFVATPLQAMAGPIAGQLPITPFNLVCTSVPGPQFSLYLLGHKMLRWYPYVPIGGRMALNCAILTYNGTTYFGFSGDVHAAPDLQKLEGLLKLSFEELKKAAGVQAPRKKAARSKAKAAPVVRIAPAKTLRPTAPTQVRLKVVQKAESERVQEPTVEQGNLPEQLIA